MNGLTRAATHRRNVPYATLARTIYCIKMQFHETGLLCGLTRIKP